MEQHYLLSDIEFQKKFEDCSLDPVMFTHEAHLRLAWLHIKKYGVDIAITNITIQLKNFTKAIGASSKYNETLTIAAIRAVYHFMLKSQQSNFKSFIDDNQRLNANFKDLIATHYSKNVFTSEEAKRKYLEPDLLPFD